MNAACLHESTVQPPPSCASIPLHCPRLVSGSLLVEDVVALKVRRRSCRSTWHQEEKEKDGIKVDEISYHPLYASDIASSTPDTLQAHLLGVVPLVLGLGGSVDGVSYRLVCRFESFNQENGKVPGVKQIRRMGLISGLSFAVE